MWYTVIVVAMLCFLTGCHPEEDKTRLGDVICRIGTTVIYEHTVISNEHGRIDWMGKWHSFREYPTLNKASITGDCQVRYKPLPETRGRYD